MKKLILLGSIVLIVLGMGRSSRGFVPYESYTYSTKDMSAVRTPVPYVVKSVYDGVDLGVGPLNSPKDIFVTETNKIYLLDSGNNRIIVLDNEYKLIKIIKDFVHLGAVDSFNNPHGIFVDEQEHIYVADTENNRVVHLNKNGEFDQIIEAPKSDVIKEGFIYRPIKIALDQSKRVYVVGEGTFEGIIHFDIQGKFLGFLGANRVTPNPWQIFWNKFSTKEQRDKMELFVPTDFSNIDIDEEGFLYVTTQTVQDRSMVRRLNPAGNDVLRKTSILPIVGDVSFQMWLGTVRGPSVFTDITIHDYGIYSCLDSKRGRIFTYDHDGNLLHIFGGLGNQIGTFRNPVAINEMEGNILVLDGLMGRLTVFEQTRYSQLVNEAVIYQYRGEYEEATEKWEEVLEISTNLQLAHIGVGRALFRQGEYIDAMKSFKLGNNRTLYSKAHAEYRKELLSKHFGNIVVLFLLLVILIKVFKKIKHNKKNRNIIHEKNLMGVQKGNKNEESTRNI